VALLALLFLWERGNYVNYAEGVYLESSRMIVHGAVPYRDFVAAHPPLLFYTGALILRAWDSIDGVRVLLSIVSLATAGLTTIAVFRLTLSRLGAGLAGLAVILAPWSLHEHATLTPETFAAPLLLAAALLSSRRRAAALGGVIAAVAVGFKWPYLLPGLALAVTATGRARYLFSLVAVVVVGAVLSVALFGAGDLYRQLVVAQEQVGWHSLRQFGGLAVQAAWNLLPLLVTAVVAARLARRSAADAALFRALLVLAITTLVLVATIAKTGTYLNVIVPVEPPLIALGVAGSVWAVRARRRWVPVLTAAWLFGAVQVAAFLSDPTHPGFFVRPLSAPAHAWVGERTVAAQLRQARRCPRKAAYSGTPFLAFLADRRMPGNEPDQFLLMTRVGAAAARAAAADTSRCP
jgi:hypothetical protein